MSFAAQFSCILSTVQTLPSMMAWRFHLWYGEIVRAK